MKRAVKENEGQGAVVKQMGGSGQIVTHYGGKGTWAVEQRDGYFSIERVSNGALLIVNSALISMADEDSDEGFLWVIPEETERFIELMKQVVTLYGASTQGRKVA